MTSYESRERIFNFLMVKARKLLYFLLRLSEHKKFRPYADNSGYIPVMSYNPAEGCYRFNCYCFGCPCNFGGLCSTKFKNIPLECLHEFDGDNIVKNYCG